MKTSVNYQSPSSLPRIHHEYSRSRLYVTRVKGSDLEVDKPHDDYYVSCSLNGTIDALNPRIYSANQLVGRDNVFIIIK